jgi:lipopolysaccharide transport system permease protein
LLRGEQVIYWDAVAVSVGVSLILFVLGIRQFRKMEKSFADLI